MKKILFLIDWFEPAYKAGGPIRSINNMARLLKDEYEIYVFTGDRDLDDKRSMKGILLNEWILIDRNIQVYYSTPDRLTWNTIARLIKSTNPDFIYCSGLYSKYFSLYPLLIKKFTKQKATVILSPHGMLKLSALSFKPLKKKLFLNLFKWLKLHRVVHFHASDNEEVADITYQFGDVLISAIADAPSPLSDQIDFISKIRGHLKILFIGRIHPIKNLDFLLSTLRFINSHVTLSIIGTVQDADYWNKCQQQILALPQNIKVSYQGEVRHEEINTFIRDHHLFYLPTKGENFGHAIFEALSVGRPVLISDQTPWRNLSQQKAGWDFSLNEPRKFSNTIEVVATMDQDEYNEWCESAWQYCNNYIQGSFIKDKYLKLFKEECTLSA